MIYTVTGVAAALAPNVEVLVAVRAVQGMAGSAGVVIGRAVVRGLASGSETARIFSLLQLVGGAVSVSAPVVGGILADPVGWRGGCRSGVQRWSGC